MAFKMKGFSAFTKNGTKVEPAKMAAEAGQAKQASEAGGAMTYDKYQEWLAKNPPKQDIVKTKEEQTKDISKDINMLLEEGASEDDDRIISMRKEIERLNK
tara:strand:- start:677 stop:979 length:303 start_codon:yes stop_codon:yes gene_type:complete